MPEKTAPRLERPAFVPRALVALTCQVLPGGRLRTRYRQELTAELYGMPRVRQTGYALQLLASSWSLRRATADPTRERRSMLTILRSKPLLCLLNVHHYWLKQSAEDGTVYERCALCGKDRPEHPMYGNPFLGGS
ncbi:hypothetical protein ACH3VR_00305 [Microbacterium sp. B2969]|uniref:Uncharacterized protein n=1 Tax=Microbacterium alkaliflavum TaxID=3248839 RepID=A0ABW7Q289_9MICO